MLRKTLTICSLVGLVLSLGLWGLSYWELGFDTGSYCIALWAGGVEFDNLGVGLEESGAGSDEDEVGWYLGGFEALETNWVPSFSRYTLGWIIGLPFWIPTIIFGSSFAYLYRHAVRRRRRLKLGQCVACGYDLTGNTSGKCPECNTGMIPNR